MASVQVEVVGILVDQVKKRHVVVVVRGLIDEGVSDVWLGRTGTGPEGFEPFLTRSRSDR